MVLLKNSNRDSKKGDKMKQRWLGPYKIKKNLENGVYRLENKEGAVLKTTVNQCRLKLCIAGAEVITNIMLYNCTLCIYHSHYSYL